MSVGKGQFNQLFAFWMLLLGSVQTLAPSFACDVFTNASAGAAVSLALIAAARCFGSCCVAFGASLLDHKLLYQVGMIAMTFSAVMSFVEGGASMLGALTMLSWSALGFISSL